MATGQSVTGRTVSLDRLLTFQAVYRNGTLTAAARLLGLSQPTVTGQVRALEAAVGQTLFVRQARGGACQMVCVRGLR